MILGSDFVDSPQPLSSGRMTAEPVDSFPFAISFVSHTGESSACCGKRTTDGPTLSAIVFGQHTPIDLNHILKFKNIFLFFFYELMHLTMFYSRLFNNA